MGPLDVRSLRNRIPLTHRHLWSSASTGLFEGASEPDEQLSVWSNPLIAMQPFPRLGSRVSLRDIIPHQALFFAKDIAGLRDLKRISVYAVPKYVLTANDLVTIDEIVGVRVETNNPSSRFRYATSSLQPGHMIGTAPPAWDETQMRHFDIDGPGGERVTSLETGQDRDLFAIKVSLTCGIL